MAVISLADVVGKGYKDFWTAKQRYRCLIGGRASKKSATTALWYVANMMKYPGSNTLVVRKVYKDHKDSTYTQIKWAIKRLGVESKWEARIAPLEIIYKPTGQKFLFRGLDDPQSITSIVAENGWIVWCWMEEAFQINSEDDFNMIDGSIRGNVPEPLFKQITLTLNPWNEKSWIKKRFFDTEDPNVFRKVTNYECNEFLGEDDRMYFETLKQMSPRRYWVEGLGNWGTTSGLVFDNWEERDFEYREIISERKHVESVFGLDFGFTTDPSAFVAGLIDLRARELFIYDEHYEKSMMNDQIAKMIIRKGYGKEKIIADSSEPKSIAEIKGYGVPRIVAARKGRDSVNNGIQFLKQFRIIVHPSCNNLIMELNNYAFSEKNGKQTNVPIDDFNHLIDAMRYAVEKYSKPNSVRLLESRRRNKFNLSY